MVMGLDLHQDIDGLDAPAIALRDTIGEESLGHAALDYRGIVSIGGQHASGILAIRRLDHVEKRLRHGSAIDDEFSIEDLVPAML